MKLGIGTAQFGLDYGVANGQGKVPESEVAKILELADQQGLQVIDTAVLYGESEKVIGRTLPSNHSFKIVTKTPRFTDRKISYNDVKQLEDTFYRSLRLMRQSSLYGLLIHDADNLLVTNSGEVVQKMLELKEKGIVKKIGVSVYSKHQIDRIVDQFAIDLIQLPLNILDQRLLANGYLSHLKSKGIEIHARSIFLQGLLLLDPESLPPYFYQVKSHLKYVHNELHRMNISPIQAALQFVLDLDEVDVVIIGVDSASQLQEILNMMHAPMPHIDFQPFSFDDEKILNPSKWNL